MFNNVLIKDPTLSQTRRYTIPSEILIAVLETEFLKLM